MVIKKIEDYEFEELAKNRLYINKYGTDLMYLYELNRYWKEFFMDMFGVFAKNTQFIITKRDNNTDLFEDLKKEYYNIIKENNLDIDINDYVEINDYVTFDEWLEDEKHDYVIVKDGIYLIIK